MHTQFRFAKNMTCAGHTGRKQCVRSSACSSAYSGRPMGSI